MPVDASTVRRHLDGLAEVEAGRLDHAVSATRAASEAAETARASLPLPVDPPGAESGPAAPPA